jgi:hypothetical protein
MFWKTKSWMIKSTFQVVSSQYMLLNIFMLFSMATQDYMLYNSSLQKVPHNRILRIIVMPLNIIWNSLVGTCWFQEWSYIHFKFLNFFVLFLTLFRSSCLLCSRCIQQPLCGTIEWHSQPLSFSNLCNGVQAVSVTRWVNLTAAITYPAYLNRITLAYCFPDTWLMLRFLTLRTLELYNFYSHYKIGLILHTMKKIFNRFSYWKAK